MEHVGWLHKVHGYRAMFQVNGKPRVFSYGAWEVTVHLFLYARTARSAPAYQEFWIEAPEELPARLLAWGAGKGSVDSALGGGSFLPPRAAVDPAPGSS